MTMKKRTIFWLSIGAILFALFACSTGPRTVTVGGNSNGQTVRLNSGETLQVELKSDPINGYGWQVEQIDPAFLQYIPKDQYTPAGQDPTTGGTQVLQFKALKSGSTHLGLTYQKTSGEGVSLPEKFQISLEIQ
jgi:predicted secreted protein